MRRRLVVLAAGMLALALLASPALAGLTIMKKGGTPCPILVDKKAHRVTQVAARGLAKYLKQISGGEFKVTKIDANAVPAGPAILVGIKAPSWKKEFFADSFAMRLQGDKLYLFGDNPTANGYAVYAFLEERLGCKWWSYNEEDVPTKATIQIISLDRHVKAQFRQHNLMSMEAQTRTNDFYLKSRAKAHEQFTGNHTLYPLLKEYGKTHPEIYPYVPIRKKGSKKILGYKRKHNDIHLCYTAPGIVDALVVALGKEVKKRKGNVKDYIYFAGMGDWYGGMCECDRCKKVYAEEKWKLSSGHSGTLIRMMNAVAEKMEKQFPGITLGTFSYMSIDSPPGKTKPRHNLVIWIPRIRYGVSHPLESPVIPRNVKFLASLKAWCQKAPGRIYMWDYAVNYGTNFFYPFPVTRTMAANIRTYKKLGCAGVMLQGNYGDYGGDLVIMKNYVWRKLMWNPNANTDKLIEEFCDGYYGPAAKALKAYIFTQEDAIAASKHYFDEFAPLGKLKKAYLTEELLKTLRIHIDRGLKATKGKEPYYTRVREAGVAFDVMKYWVFVRYLREKDGKLVRRDFNDEYTYPHALEMIKYTRGGAPREFGRGKAYAISILETHGGPLLSLKSDVYKVDYAPVQRGKMFQMYYKGTPLLAAPFDRKYKGKPQTIVRGSGESLRQICVYLDWEAGDKKIVMNGGGGIDKWSIDDKVKMKKTIEKIDANSFRITGSSHRVSYDKKRYGKEHAKPWTYWHVGEGPMVRVQLSKDGKTWTDVDFNAAAAEEENKKRLDKLKPIEFGVDGANNHIRITMPGKGVVVEEVYAKPHVTRVEFRWDYIETHLRVKTILSEVDNGYARGKKARDPELWCDRTVRLLPYTPNK
jgi:Domain of unknown function (DUF4838)